MDSVGRTYETVHLDDGANVMLIVSPGMIDAARAHGWTSNATVSSVAKGTALRLEGEATLAVYALCAGGDHELVQLKGHKAPGARRNIVPPQLLEKSMGAMIGYHTTKHGPPTYDIVFASGAEWLVLEYNDLFFAFVKVGNSQVISRMQQMSVTGDKEAEINEAEINSSNICSKDPKVWASRLATGSDGLKMIRKAVQGMEDMRLMTIEDMHTIDNDRHRRAQVAKRVPVDKRRDPKERIFTSGSIFYVDGFTYSGRDQVRQIADRTGTTSPTACLHAIDASDSRYKYGRNVSTHTTEDLISFLEHVVTTEAALGHTVRVFKFDRAPEVDCDTLKRRVEGELKVSVLIAPSGEHEGVHAAEQMMDSLARTSEAMLQRAARNLGSEARRFQALAHMYAMYLDNRKPDKDGKPSRMQRHSGRIPDFGDKKGMTPYVFGCRVIRLRDENERANWKGAGRRVADGIFVGIDHTSYMVYNHATGRVTFEPFIWALDELELSRTGAAAGSAQHDVGCQIELSTAEPLVLLSSKENSRAPKPIDPIVIADAPVGTRIKVYWQGAKNQPELDKWYEGTVVSCSSRKNRPTTSPTQRSST